MNNLGPWEKEEQFTRFCSCVLDSETQTLQTDTDFVRLRSKLWQVLLELVRNPNKLVLRDSLIQSIWHGNGYTGEQGLTHAICHLRRILKKHNVQAQIVTLPKKGYILRYQEKSNTSHSVHSLEVFPNAKDMKQDNTQFISPDLSVRYNFN